MQVVTVISVKMFTVRDSLLYRFDMTHELLDYLDAALTMSETGGSFS